MRNRKFQKNKKYSYVFFSSQNRFEKDEKRRKIKIIVSFRSVPTQREIENFKKIPIKLTKLKYTILASFQAKIGWTMPRKRKSKNYQSVPFLHDA